jgi:hypothetical protein
MKSSAFLFLVVLLLIACNKDRFSTEPQISLIGLSPDIWSRTNLNLEGGPKLSIRLTDLEGDFGAQNNLRSFVYLRDTSAAFFRLDSFPFPDLPITNTKNLDVQLDFRMIDVMRPSGLRPVDTFHFEVFVKDLGNHKSNVIMAPPLVLTP